MKIRQFKMLDMVRKYYGSQEQIIAEVKESKVKHGANLIDSLIYHKELPESPSDETIMAYLEANETFEPIPTLGETFLSYEESLEFKKLGFDWPTLGYYTGKDKEIYLGNEDLLPPFNPRIDSNVMFRAPTFDQIVMWALHEFSLSVYICSSFTVGTLVGHVHAPESVELEQYCSPKHTLITPFIRTGYLEARKETIQLVIKAIKIIKNK